VPDRQAQPVLNIDLKTVAGFGEEWAAFDQRALTQDEWRTLFDNYFSTFPFNELPKDAEGFDLGCGSGRWASGVAPRVGMLHCIDPSNLALEVARKRLGGQTNVAFYLAGSDTIPLADGSQDFGYSLGVLHHIPDTQAAMRSCVDKLKPGAPFLVYLYYSLDNRPPWFRGLWRASDSLRKLISRLPFGLRKLVTSGLAAGVYWPLARVAGAGEKAGLDVARLPLSFYRHSSFYTMRTDALDRFGTRLEHRFSRAEIETMMKSSGLTDIRFREGEPYWVACGSKA
jgi:SAM-dependent methyltransferase